MAKIRESEHGGDGGGQAEGDATLWAASVATGGRVVTVEDHWAEGGLGDAVLDALAVDTRVVKLAVRNMPGSATPSEQLQSAGIDATHIVDAALDLIGRPGIRRHTGRPTGEWAAAAEEFEVDLGGREREPALTPPAPATDTGEWISLPEPEGALVWVTLAEASKRTGVAAQTLRHWQHTGRLRRRVVSTPDGTEEIVPLQEIGGRGGREITVIAGRRRRGCLTDWASR